MASTDLEKQPLLEAQGTASNTNEPANDATLAELQQNVFKAQREYMKAWSRTTSGKWHKRIMLGVTGLLLTFLLFCISVIAVQAMTEDDAPYSSGRVPLEIGIMSKCPDARDCLHDMILPAMQNVSHKVDFKMSYIGSNTDHDDGVSCMHGPQECLGNILELCAAKLYPTPRMYLGFTMCMSNQYEDIPQKELVEECALEHGMSFDKIQGCADAQDGAVGMDMLRTSFNRTSAMGISKSCTVMLGDDLFAVRDGGKWKDAENGTSAHDLVREVNRRYQPSLAYSDW